MTDSPLLSLPGAVDAAGPSTAAPGGPDAGVAAHYGDPLREQRILETGTALVDRSNRSVVRVEGPDRLAWLHSLLSQHLAALPPLHGTEALLLDPQGHIEQHVGVVDDGTATWLLGEPGSGPALADFLDRMRFLLRVEVADVTGSWAVLTLAGPDAPALRPPHLVARVVDDAVDLLVARGELTAVAGALIGAGATPVGMDAVEAVRVARRRARLGLDTDHRTIPHEVGWLDTAVHLDKGCYRGQETVARVHNLGRPPRRLVLVHLDGADLDLPTAGTPLTDPAGRRVGRLGTAARHHELGPVALALVKQNVAPGATLQAGDVAVALDPDEMVDVSERRARPQLQRF